MFVWAFAPKPRMLVFGAIDFAAAVARVGAFLGYHVTVCDARPVFATNTRFPEADEVVVDWPHRYFPPRSRPPAASTSAPSSPSSPTTRSSTYLLEVALRLPAVAYVGAMGSRRTHDDRIARLLEAGLDQKEIDRLSSPIGLDLGARTPEETAVSIAAEIIAVRWGGTGEHLASTDGRIHRDLDFPGGDGTRWPAVLLLLSSCWLGVQRRPGAHPRGHLGAAPAATASDHRRATRRATPRPRDPSRLAGHARAVTKPAPSKDLGARAPARRQPVPLPALMREKFRGSRITQVRVQAETDAYTRSEVTYRSGDVTVSGVLLRPRKGTVPDRAQPRLHRAVHLRHRPGPRARAGLPGPPRLLVLHTDYRGHASDPALPWSARPGWATPATPSTRCWPSRRSRTSTPTGWRCWAGRWAAGSPSTRWSPSPGLVDVGVVYASVSLRYLDNLRHFTIPGRPEAAQALFDRFGTPQQEPAFYRQLSSRTYFDRITEVLMLHGTRDESCRSPGAHDGGAARKAGVRHRLVVYPGEMHLHPALAGLHRDHGAVHPGAVPGGLNLSVRL